MQESEQPETDHPPVCRTMTSRYAFFKKTTLLGISLGVSLFLLEISIRTLLPTFDPGRQISFRYNADGVPLGPVGKTVRQSTPKGDYDLFVTFNSLGFRDRKDITTSTPLDWFVLGDSFALGWGVEETNRFSDILETNLGLRVFNISIPTDIMGYQLLFNYATGRGAIISNLIVSVCMENDLLAYSERSHLVAPMGTPSPKERVRAFAKTHSAFYLCLSHSLQRSPTIRNLFETVGISRKPTGDELMNKNKYNESELHNAADLLINIGSNTARTVVLVLPSRALWVGDNREMELRIHEYFVNTLRQGGIEVVDMKSPFEETGDPMQFYFKTDPHWNEKGHRYGAQRLVSQITK